MRKIMAFIVVICLAIYLGYLKEKTMKTNLPIQDENAYKLTAKRDVLSLMAAYPEEIVDVEQKDNIYLVMKSGKRILYDDKKIKTSENKTNNPDLQDAMEQIYPLHDITEIAIKDINPGRMRNYELLKEIYGGSEGEVRRNITNLKAGAGYFQFNSRNRAASSLKSAMDEIEALAKVRPDIRKFVIPTSGTFNYRNISGTNRLSPHAFGIAIDLRRDKRDYWQWATRQQGQERLQEYSREVVRIFENNNFIWGGKWERFDILHFEYRPELVIKSRYFAGKPVNLGAWYDGAPVDRPEIKGYIEKIDRVIK